MNYVYLIINTKLNKFYIGSRKCKGEPEDDIGCFYFSSSTDKEFIKDQKINPGSYDYLVLEKFSTTKEAKEYETKAHKTLNVGVNENFYNLARQTSTGFCYSGKGEKNHFYGKKHTKEVREKMSRNRRGVPLVLSEAQKIARSIGAAKKFKGEEGKLERQKVSEQFQELKWMYSVKLDKHKRAKKQDINKLLKEGYKMGKRPITDEQKANYIKLRQAKPKKMWICNVEEHKEMLVELDSYLNKGWIQGRLKSTTEKISKKLYMNALVKACDSAFPFSTNSVKV